MDIELSGKRGTRKRGKWSSESWAWNGPHLLSLCIKVQCGELAHSTAAALQRAQTLCRCFPFLAPLLLPTPHQSLPNPTDSRPAGGGGGDGAAAGAPEIGRDLSRSQGQTPTSLSPYPPLSRLDLLVVAPVKWRGWRIWDVGAGEGRHQLRISLRDIMVSNSENREKRSR
jgi:hypothetical protein